MNEEPKKTAKQLIEQHRQQEAERTGASAKVESIASRQPLRRNVTSIGRGPTSAVPQSDDAVKMDDFRAYMPTHSYIFLPTREQWPASSVNARVPPVPLVDANSQPVLVAETGKQKYQAANAWLDQNRAVEQMTWAPGFPDLIEGRLIADGGWIQRPGAVCLNLYIQPNGKPGDAAAAGPWVDHVHRVYGEYADHIIRWLAQRVQQPEVKINHALVLGGNPGVGKDTLLEPVKDAVGPWNFKEASPDQLVGRFNGFLKSVILRVSEARDLGEINRYQLYDRLKTYTASPPDVLRVDEKHLREHSVFNIVGVVITTNYKAGGIFLPPDDRRHYVAWTDLVKDDFATSYWNGLYAWYDASGKGHVAAYLRQLDIAQFNPKAPPPKTRAFWDIVSASAAPEDSDLADILDKLGRPDAVTLKRIAAEATGDFQSWFTDRRNRRSIPHRMETCGYLPVRNDGAADGHWKINGTRQAVYSRRELSLKAQLEAVHLMVEYARTGGGEL
jgi:hypothetical protein